MRIAFLVRAMESGGAERAASSLAQTMASRGHDVTLFVLLGHTSFYPVDDTVRIVYLQPKEDRKFGTLQRFWKLRKIVRELHPDVLVGMSPFMSAYAVAGCFGRKAVPVGTERANPFVLYANRKTTLFRKAVSFLCKGFVCQTEKALTFFPRAVRRKAAVIPNAVFNPHVYSVSVPNERAKEITAVGRLDRNKGFDVLLEAFARVHAALPAYTLTIYGEGPERPALLSLAERLGISSAVSLPGNREDALSQIASSSVYVLSSRSEGMPNALIEAMAVGVPCVSTRCDMGPAELIEDGENGLLVPVDDHAAMADAVLRILRDDALAASLSEKARDIRRTLDPDAVCTRWIDYFVALLQ